MISADLIESTAVELLRMAVTKLPQDVEAALRNAYASEDAGVAKMQLKAILDNIKLAEAKCAPMCQDTGIHIFYITLGSRVASSINFVEVEDAVIRAVRRGTNGIPLRPNAVHPLTRANPGDNVGAGMPYINYKISDNDYIEIAVMPKGAGSENMSALKMLTPAEGLGGIKRFVLNSVLEAGGKPCPPTVVGVGIGGAADIAVHLAKEALLRPLDLKHSDGEIAALEDELYSALNATGIGPMGLGGKTTVLGVKIESAYCHTASLPVAVNIQCWAARKAVARIYTDGKVHYLTHTKTK